MIAIGRVAGRGGEVLCCGNDIPARLHYERKMIQNPLMSTSSAALVRKRINALPERSFVRVRDLDEGRGVSTRAVEVAISRLAHEGVVRPIRKGLYWKGPRTPTGMLPPTPAEVGVAIGGTGSGPSDLAAVRFLGLTTQVPVKMDMAVPGRAPASVPGIEFHSRPYTRAMHGLNPAEVAVLEVLRMWPSGVEEDWEVLRDRVADLVKNGIIRTGQVSAAVADERTPAARSRWEELADSLVASG